MNLTNNVFGDNEIADSSMVDDGYMTIVSTSYTCGPAALVTILRYYGVYTTESEIAKLAGTDSSGTSFEGLQKAGLAKGFIFDGAKVPLAQLKVDYLVMISVNGRNHFELIRNINSTHVVLFDPNLRIITLTLEKFGKLYTGNIFALNSTLDGFNRLTAKEMHDLKGFSWHGMTFPYSINYK